MRPTQSKRKTGSASFYASLRQQASLWSAWQAVQQNALQSRSAETAAEAKEFGREIRTHLSRIAAHLRYGRFQFKPQRGVLIQKKGKSSKRPIVVAPIESRIVQRAILEAVHRVPAIDCQLKSGFNFGGVPGSDFGVPRAIVKAHAAIQERTYFIRTDIKSFFMHVPRERAVRQVLDHIDDPDFQRLFENATTTEIEDGQRYGADVGLFPIHDEGVAQGSCLSPLLCNLLLADFDRRMNDRGIVTIRYIDDFLILAPTRAKAFKAYDHARAYLADLGLDAYDPRVPGDASKADSGECRTGIPFLGCQVFPDSVRPSREKTRELKARIRDACAESLTCLANPTEASRHHLTYAETLDRVSKMVRGWANTMAFCTDDRVMNDLDAEISSIVEQYGKGVAMRVRALSPLDRRRALGVFSIADRVTSASRDEILAEVTARRR